MDARTDIDGDAAAKAKLLLSRQTLQQDYNFSLQSDHLLKCQSIYSHFLEYLDSTS